MKMPASGGDPVSTTLRLAFSPGSKNGDLDCGIETSAKRALLTRIEFEPATNYQSSVLNTLKSKYIVVNTKPATTNNNKAVNGSGVNNKKSNNITLPVPKLTLFPPERVQLGYRGNLSVGSGMSNMGNTCYLNSTLQALFHVPALVNWLVSETAHQNCVQNSDYQMHPDDITCSVIKTFKCSQQKTGNCMKPISVYSKLKAICKHLSHGSQEDAHEFMRYLLESLEKNYLTRFQGHKLDSTSKETTPINQIFGGYIRTEVVCLSCRAVSTTFQHFQDLPLDIRKASTLNDALAGYFERERLPDGEDAYKCEKCNRKVSVTKKFSIEKPPNVLCVQLKRFSITNGKITKQVQLPQFLDITRFISPNIQPRHPVKYKLVSMVTHMGQSVNCGHYTAIALAANGSYYQFDDSSVRQIPLSTVLNMSAYLILYEMERPFQTNPRPFSAASSTVWNGNLNSSTCSSSSSSGGGIGGEEEEPVSWSQKESTPSSNSLASACETKNKREGTDSQSRMVYQLNKHGKVYAPPVCPTTREPPSTNHQLHAKTKGSRNPVESNNEKRSSLVPYESDVSTDSDVENKERSELEKLLTKLSSSTSSSPSPSVGAAAISSASAGTTATTSSSPPPHPPPSCSSSSSSSSSFSSNSSSSSPAARGWKVTELDSTFASSTKSGTTDWDVTDVTTSKKKPGRNLSDTELSGGKRKKARASGSDSELEKSSTKLDDRKKRTSILEKYKCNFGKGPEASGRTGQSEADDKAKPSKTRENDKMSFDDLCSSASDVDNKSTMSSSCVSSVNLKGLPFERSSAGGQTHLGSNGYSNGRSASEASAKVQQDENNHHHHHGGHSDKGPDKYENGFSPRKDPDQGICDLLERDFQKKRNVVNTLLQSSHWGYGNSNVKSWNGTQSEIESKVAEEKSESTKRSYNDMYNEDFDRGKVKKLKTHEKRDRPRHNMFQNYQDKMNFQHWRGNNRNHRRYGNNFRNPFKRQPFHGQFNGNNHWNYSSDRNYKFFKGHRSNHGKGLQSVRKYFPGMVPGSKKNQSG